MIDYFDCVKDNKGHCPKCGSKADKGSVIADGNYYICKICGRKVGVIDDKEKNRLLEEKR